LRIKFDIFAHCAGSNQNNREVKTNLTIFASNQKNLVATNRKQKATEMAGQFIEPN
jgi:hypothetical protein